MITELTPDDTFCDYYQQWVAMYKEGAVRDVTLSKYRLTCAWLERLIPHLALADLNRITYQKLLNDLDLGSEVNWDWMILLIAKTGLRFSEAIALTPADFEFGRQVVSVNKAWDYKTGTGFVPTKNRSSVRKVQLDWQLVIRFSTFTYVKTLFILHNVMKSITLCNMNKVIEKTVSGTLSTRELCPWLLSRGVTAVDTEEVSYLLGIPEDQVRQRLAPLRRRGELTTGGRGIWIPVPPDKLEWGAPEPIAYLDAIMKMRGIEYCVCWLSAAALYGAAHQAPQVFQVATNRPFRDREIGRSLLRFYNRADLGKVSKRSISTASGTVVVASPESTALMLASDLELAGGLDNAATAIVELADSGALSDCDLARSASVFSDSASRRVGFLLERFAENDSWPELANYCASLKSEPSYLAPSFGNMQRGPYNARWGLFENREVAPDL